jgi:hypothetical protein
MDSHFRAAGVHFVHRANLPDCGATSGCAKNTSHETVKLIEKYEIESRDQITRDEVTALALIAKKPPVAVTDTFQWSLSTGLFFFFHPHKCNEACN